MSNKFAVAKNNIQGPNSLIQKNEIGLVESTNDDSSKVFFVTAWEHVEVSNNDIEIIDIKKTGDAFPKKICNVCHKLLDTSIFDKNQNGINNRTVRRPSCKDCRKIIDGVNMTLKTKKEWDKTKPKEVPFECPVCKKRTIAGVTSKVVLDHNHINGSARGWICDSCNTGIGRFKDDESIVIRALEYLRNN